MAGGPVYAFSEYVGGAGNLLFPHLYVGGGANAAKDMEGYAAIASLSSDATAEFHYQIPEALPTGTPNILFRCRAPATAGVAKWTVSDARVANGSDPSAATLQAETQSSLTWAAGDTDKIKDVLVPLTALPLVLTARDILVCAFKFQTLGWTLAQVMNWGRPTLIWV